MVLLSSSSPSFLKSALLTSSARIEAVPLEVQQIFKPYCLLCMLFMNLTASKCVGYTCTSQLYPSHGVVKMGLIDGSVSEVATM